MDLEDLQSRLNALSRLYGLLISDVEELQSHKSEILDEKARLLLKELLDGAAEKMLKLTSEVVSTKLGVFNTCSVTQQQKRQHSQKLPLLLTNSSIPSVLQGTHKDPSTQEATNLSENFNSVEQTAKPVPSEQSQMRSFLSEPQRKKRCRVCLRSNSKQMKITVQRNFSSSSEAREMDQAIVSLEHQLNNLSGQYQVDKAEKEEQASTTKAIINARINKWPSPRRILEFQSNPSEKKFATRVSGNEALGLVKSGALRNCTNGKGKKLEETDFISKEASDAIKVIESRISALRVGGKHEGSLQKKNAAQNGVFEFSAGSVSGAGAFSPVMLNGLAGRGDQTHVCQFVLGRNDSNSCLTNRKIREPKNSIRSRQVPRQMVNSLVNVPKQSVRNPALISPCNVVHSELSLNDGKSDGISLRHCSLSQVGGSSEGLILGTQSTNVVPFQNVKDVVERNSQNSQMPKKSHKFVEDHLIQSNLDRNAKKNILPAKLQSEISKENVDGNQPSNSVAVSTGVMRLDRKKQQFAAGSKLIRTNTRAKTQRGKGLPHRTTAMTNLRDKKRGQYILSQSSLGDEMEEKRCGMKKKIIQQSSSSDEQESGSTSPSLRSSSSWTTHQGSTSYHDSEEYLFTDASRSQQTSNSTTGNEREVYCSPRTARGHHSDYSDSGTYSVSSRTQSQQYYTSSSENGGYLPSDPTSSSHSIRIPSRRVGRTSSYGSTNRKVSEKRIGRLRKLKDKLALIFHHHHHHHHHHHYNSNDDVRSDQHSKSKHGTSLWRRAGTLFHRKSSDELYGEQAAEKLRKSMVHHGRDKKRGGNFHTLVDGLVRHVRHSKKPKRQSSSKGSTGHAAEGHHVSKKVAKKVHWWKILRHHGGVKMPKKPRVKLRFGSKKPQLKTLKTIKWR